MDVYEQNLAPVIAAERVDKKEVNKYGIIDINEGKDKTNKVTGLVEKPDIKSAPSNLAVIGKYIVTPEVLQALVKVKPDKGGEIRLIDALKSVLATQDVYSHEYEGTRYDCGSKLGFLKATIHFGLQHKELKRDFAKYLKSIKI
jgi:UTP--glucose-1-phosphate uridylyltransferase